MTELKDLRRGDEVTLTVKGEVHATHEDYAIVMYSPETGDWFEIHASDIEDGSVVIHDVKKPLPTEPGVYVPANNKGYPESSYIYKLTGARIWIQLRGDGINQAAEIEARKAHEALGGLVRLVPEQ